MGIMVQICEVFRCETKCRKKAQKTLDMRGTRYKKHCAGVYAYLCAHFLQHVNFGLLLLSFKALARPSRSDNRGRVVLN